MAVVLVGRLGQLVALELRFGRHHRRVMAQVRLHRAFARVVAVSHAARHDVAVGDGAEVAPVLGVIDDRHHRDVLHPHQRRHFRAGGAGGGDDGVVNHHFGCPHGA